MKVSQVLFCAFLHLLFVQRVPLRFLDLEETCLGIMGQKGK